ncbi:ribosomal protein RSM22 (predicted rRNA methylase) [Allocatelliglobosispora scoriae]|uniref:Ribosomal protein RSM22 (Predicted rRNA methylase) n=1 Tax=Allocatelliglobosispora scoriae TaxID=643052 RepID=A0A841BYH1_9ACTN|nr:small ribosomal subunit Rsm22 family protein [Allocatelliglobosispora scoriae]MBB5871842.1 ribosomal protein RSM22 (predicted rRNA methylase) [Allocatelliglobosispora scoriae]
MSEQLSAALTAALAGVPTSALAAAANRLITSYRADRSGAPASPIMGSRVDVAAYAAYRMPATFASVRAALRQAAQLMPDFRPGTQLDVGGGTGAAAWAAREVFPGLTDILVVDQVADALAFGEKLLPRARWQQLRLGAGAELPSADLVTLAYVLNELSPDDQAALTRELAGKAQLLAIIEPGTPAGYTRILAARELLIEAGLHIVAPCPHEGACPLPAGRDWCHFGARLNRSALHRSVKEGAELSYEDEKYAYVIATPLPADRAVGRVLRQPAYAKGMVTLRLCDADGTAHPEIVSKRHGELYKRARDVTWGDAWPP